MSQGINVIDSAWDNFTSDQLPGTLRQRTADSGHLTLRELGLTNFGCEMSAVRCRNVPDSWSDGRM